MVSDGTRVVLPYFETLALRVPAVPQHARTFRILFLPPRPFSSIARPSLHVTIAVRRYKGRLRYSDLRVRGFLACRANCRVRSQNHSSLLQLSDPDRQGTAVPPSLSIMLLGKFHQVLSAPASFKFESCRPLPQADFSFAYEPCRSF